MKIGEYDYPIEVTFADALKIAELAIKQYDGKMANKDIGQALGYEVKNPAAISGYIYRKFDEICLYGVMKRDRGFMVTTDIAKEALDPYDPQKAQEGKAKLIRQMSVVNKAFTEWNGEIPQETAFPSKLVDLLSIQWQEAQKHAEALRKLFIELFPYLKPVQSPVQTGAASGASSQFAVNRAGGESSRMEQKQGTGDLTISARAAGFGFTKTLPFTHSGIKELKKLIDFLEGQAIEEKEIEKETKTNT